MEVFISLFSLSIGHIAGNYLKPSGFPLGLDPKGLYSTGRIDVQSCKKLDPFCTFLSDIVLYFTLVQGWCQ